MEKLLYVCNIVTDRTNKVLYGNKLDLFPFQHDKFHKQMIKGLGKNNITVTVLSSRNISRTVSKKIFFPMSVEMDNDIKYIYVPIINIPLIKNLVVFLSAFFFSMFWLIKNRKSYVICDPLNVTISAGTMLLSKLLLVPITSIVTDVPSKMATEGSLSFTKIAYYIIKKSSNYVFLTENMVDLFGNKKKQHVIIEGLISEESRNWFDNNRMKFDLFTFTYAGACHIKYGIRDLVEAFLELNLTNSQLIIFGSGDYSEELSNISERNENIKYMKSKSNSTVMEYEYKSHILVNPRPCSGEYTKYSFPSKLIEYMSTGTPVLTTKLPGIPKDYDDYFIYFDSDSKTEIKNKMYEVYNYNRDCLENLGIRSKTYVYKFKNDVVQCNKILQMLRTKRSNNGNIQ